MHYALFLFASNGTLHSTESVLLSTQCVCVCVCVNFILGHQMFLSSDVWVCSTRLLKSYATYISRLYAPRSPKSIKTVLNWYEIFIPNTLLDAPGVNTVQKTCWLQNFFLFGRKPFFSFSGLIYFHLHRTFHFLNCVLSVSLALRMYIKVCIRNGDANVTIL